MSGELGLATDVDQSTFHNHSIAGVHPDRLAVLASLFGLNPPAVGKSRVLQIGCGAGNNLIAIALALPGCTCIGIDDSHRKIAAAHSLANQVDVKNVEFRAMNLLEAVTQLGQFDYILCHGVYSWVAESVRRQILTLCREKLTAHGVALISYNVFPGWHGRLAVREFMRTFSARETNFRRRLVTSRLVLENLVRSLAGVDTSHARRLRDEASLIRATKDSDLAHDYLDSHNEPIYYHRFVAQAESEGLRVIADARFSQMSENQPESVQRNLLAAGDEPVLREQYLDFLQNRSFRRSILCHAEAPANRIASPHVLSRFRVSALAFPESTSPESQPFHAESFRLRDGSSRFQASDRTSQAIFSILAEASPRSIPFDDLAEDVDSRLSRDPRSTGLIRDFPLVARVVLKAYGSGLLDLETEEPAFMSTATDRPMASPLARLEDASGRRELTDLRHRLVSLSEFDRFVLRHLDGRRDRPGLVSAMIDAILSGEFAIHLSGRPILDPLTLREILGRSLEPSLSRLASASLLMQEELH